MIMVSDISEREEIKNRVLDSISKKHIILLIYKILEDNNVSPNYGVIHKCIKSVQDVLEEKYNYTLNYRFKDGKISSIYDIWDIQLQKDIERYDAVGKLVDNHNVDISEDLSGYYSHELKISSRPKGLYLINNHVKENLKKYFKNFDELIVDLERACIV